VAEEHFFNSASMGSKNKNRVEAASTSNGARDSGNHENKGKSSGKIITDARFTSLHTDPRFMEGPRNKAKVAIDSRFNRMFTDKNFATSKARIDKRGKPKKKESTVDSLKHYYRSEKLFKDEESGDESEDDGSESRRSEESESESEEEKRKKRNLRMDSESEELEMEDAGSDDSSTSTMDSVEEDDEVYEEEGALLQVEMNYLDLR
jgi:hypothetical protein